MSGMNVFSFLAIPFFIFAGELMLRGGIADKIVDFAKTLVGRVRGGLGMSVSGYKIPNLGFSEAIRYAPLVISGVLIISFSIEHVMALLQEKKVVPSWH